MTKHQIGNSKHLSGVRSTPAMAVQSEPQVDSSESSLVTNWMGKGGVFHWDGNVIYLPFSWFTPNFGLGGFSSYTKVLKPVRCISLGRMVFPVIQMVSWWVENKHSYIANEWSICLSLEWQADLHTHTNCVKATL